MLYFIVLRFAVSLRWQVLRARCQQYSIKGVLQARRHLNLVFSDFMCRCVACRSGSVPLVWNILALALETVRPLTKDNWKFMKRTWKLYKICWILRTSCDILYWRKGLTLIVLMYTIIYGLLCYFLAGFILRILRHSIKLYSGEIVMKWIITF